MRNAVQFLFGVANAGDFALLCPSFSNIGMFSGCDQRGWLYEECVEELKRGGFIL
jgi:UDP-N-acetylmuramoylalanine-D-glutamate ligase